MSAMGTVAAIVPAYNAAGHLAACIESILAQTVPVDEVIVVDDGSRDNTREVIESFGPRVRCISQPNQGPGAARNNAIRSTKAEWIAFLDADDAWAPNKIEVQMKAAREHPNYAILHTDAAIFGPDGNAEANFHADKRPVNEWIFDRLLQTCFVLISTVMARRSVLTEGGLFTESKSLYGVEDYDFWLRLSRKHRFWTVPEPLTLRTRQPGSLSFNTGTMAAGEILILKSVLELPLNAAQRSKAKKQLARAYFNLSYATRERNAQEAVSLAWQCLQTDPTRLASAKLLVGSLLAAVKAPRGPVDAG